MKIAVKSRWRAFPLTPSQSSSNREEKFHKKVTVCIVDSGQRANIGILDKDAYVRQHRSNLSTVCLLLSLILLLTCCAKGPGSLNAALATKLLSQDRAWLDELAVIVEFRPTASGCKDGSNNANPLLRTLEKLVAGGVLTGESIADGKCGVLNTFPSNAGKERKLTTFATFVVEQPDVYFESSSFDSGPLVYRFVAARPSLPLKITKVLCFEDQRKQLQSGVTLDDSLLDKNECSVTVSVNYTLTPIYMTIRKVVSPSELRDLIEHKPEWCLELPRDQSGRSTPIPQLQTRQDPYCQSGLSDLKNVTNGVVTTKDVRFGLVLKYHNERGVKVARSPEDETWQRVVHGR